MKLLFDFFPLLLFFAAFKLFDIYVATGVAIAASAIQVTGYWLRHRRFEQMHLWTLGIIVVSGGLTLYFHDETFIKWKPTLINWVFAVLFLGSQLIGEKPLVERMMASAIELPAVVWRRLNLSWVLFFFALGGVNLYVIYHFDTPTWVNFKVFGLMGLTLVFVLVQAVYMSRHMKHEEPEGHG